MEVKLLTAGYGAGNGPGMTLLHKPWVAVDDRMESVLWNYSCHAKFAKKIRICLEKSGRYDCWVQPGWIYHQYFKLKKDLYDIGIKMVITSVPEWDKKMVDKGKIIVENVRYD